MRYVVQALNLSDSTLLWKPQAAPLVGPNVNQRLKPSRVRGVDSAVWPKQFS